MALDSIKQLLQQSIGLHSRSIGDVSIERAIRQRMDFIQMSAADDYLALLQRDSSELKELIEEVVVPETWFFRNRSPFDALSDYISQAEDHGQQTPLRILSLPCSTGEEPYSIAMVLLEKGFSAEQFSIDALDVSQRALDKAQRAVYGRNSFREAYRDLRGKYFDEVDQGFRLKDDVRRCVRFSQANVITDNFTGSQQKYDVIFCRNLLIYFEHTTQAAVLKKLHGMLKTGGVICVGHAESSQVSPQLFKSLDIPMAFAFRAISAVDSPRALRQPARKTATGKDAGRREKSLRNLRDTFQNLVDQTEKDLRIASRVSQRHPASVTRTGQVRKELSEKNKVTTVANNSIASGASGIDELQGLEEISRTIEQGRLSAAGKLAGAYLKQYPDSADAHYYLGMISHFEGGQGSAEVLLKKALYLDPRHHAAMGLLSLIAEGRGDDVLASTYRRRQQRVIHQDVRKGEGLGE